jgi:hypothetical protein
MTLEVALFNALYSKNNKQKTLYLIFCQSSLFQLKRVRRIPQ